MNTNDLMKKESNLPVNWMLVKLGEVAEKISSKVLPSEMPKAKFIGMDCIEPHSLIPTFTYNFSEFKSAGNYFEKGQVLYGRMRPYLNKVYKTQFTGVCSGEFIVLKCIQDFIPDYLKYILHSKEFVRFANGKTSGDRPRISYEEISEYSILKPPLAEQYRIVSKIEELFSSLDKGIESLNTALKELKIYRQAVLKYAFEGKLTNTRKIELVSLSQLIEQPRYGTSKKCDYKIKGTAVLRIPNIIAGAIDNTDLKYAVFDEDEIETYRLREGDILTIRSNGSVDLVGRCAVITKRDVDFLFAGYLIRLRPIETKINSNYLLHTLSSHELRTQIEKKAKSTSGVNNINAQEIKSLLVPYCSVEDQRLIVNEIESRLSVCDKIEEGIIQSLAQAESLRQSILKKAFEGKLVPQDPNDEPVEKFLEKIKDEKERSLAKSLKSKKRLGKNEKS